MLRSMHSNYKYFKTIRFLSKDFFAVIYFSFYMILIIKISTKIYILLLTCEIVSLLNYSFDCWSKILFRLDMTPKQIECLKQKFGL